MALIRSNSAGHQGSRSQMTLGFGGAESNLSVALTRLGNHVTWFSQLGADAFGRMIATELRGEGIDVRAKTIDDAPTGLMVKTSGLAGTQDVTYYRKDSAAARISDSDIPENLFAGADLFHTSGITLAISKSARETCLVALKKRSRNRCESPLISTTARACGRKKKQRPITVKRFLMLMSSLPVAPRPRWSLTSIRNQIRKTY